MSQLPRKADHALPRLAATTALLAVAWCIAAVVLNFFPSSVGADVRLHRAFAAVCTAAAFGLVTMVALFRSLLALHGSISALDAAMRQLPESAGRIEPAAYAPSPVIAPTTPGASTPEILRLLEEIRENSLLSDHQKREKSQRNLEQEIAAAEQTIARMATADEIGKVKSLLDALESRYPHDPRLQHLREQFADAQEEHESNDIHEITRQINDLIIVSAWQRARELAVDLQQRHPNSLEARQLLLHVERENATFSDEQRRRMAAEVQRFASRKRWEGALAAAKTFLERFPDAPEAEALRIQIPTLESNAQIEHRQQIESQIMDFARHGRYIEAAQLARSVIEQYPDSPQADALRAGLSRLEELANNPDAPPARVRVD